MYILTYMFVFLCTASVGEGNDWISCASQIIMSSLPSHFHSHLSVDLWEALKVDMVHGPV